MSDPRIDEYEALVRHHLACERITEEMAMLLGHVAEGHKPSDLGLRIAHVLSSWEAHQWPDLRSGVSGPSDLTRRLAGALRGLVNDDSRFIELPTDDEQARSVAAFSDAVAALAEFDALGEPK